MFFSFLVDFYVQSYQNGQLPAKPIGKDGGIVDESNALKTAKT